MSYVSIILLLCSIVIFSYLFDLFARKTKFPSVILLIFLGMVGKYMADLYGFEVPYINLALPLLGSLGLILIVLEGALELKITKEKRLILLRGLVSALAILLVTSFVLAYGFHYVFQLPIKQALINAVPLSIISSSVAIPSSSGLPDNKKEFIVYESTFSDILGIILFNFIITREAFNFEAYLSLGIEIVLVFFASMILTYLLLELMGRITHHVQFFLILSILIMAFIVGKKLHLSSLIIIFFFGLTMSNLKALIPRKWKHRIRNVQKGGTQLHQFYLLTAESAFLIRTFFFLFFGFSIILTDLVDIYSYLVGICILIIVLMTRFLYLFITQRKSILPDVFIGPRGLITILLFLQIPDEYRSEFLDEKVLLAVILGSMFIMMYGAVSYSHGQLNADARHLNDLNQNGDDNQESPFLEIDSEEEGDY